MTEANYFFIDTHAHLDLFGTNESIAMVIKEARKDGVEKIVAIGDNLDSSRRVAGLTEQFKRVYGAAGIHPHHADSVDDNMIQQLRAVSNQPKVVAIGETGLDFYKLHSNRENQIRVFKAHIEMSKRVELPLIIHCRDAYPEIIEILTEMKVRPDEFVIHCFSGSDQDAVKLLEMGSYISFAGNVTFANAGKLREALDIVPLNRLLLETDCPYLAPDPHRGRQNRPSMLPLIAKTVAKEKKMEVEQLAKVTSENADNLFNFN